MNQIVRRGGLRACYPRQHGRGMGDLPRHISRTALSGTRLLDGALARRLAWPVLSGQSVH